MWYSLIIPVVVTLFAYHYWPHKITAAELCVPIGLTFAAILISYFSIKTITMRDIEFNNDLVVEARYYESWDTWVTRTCSRSCGYKGRSRCYYDCSFCDHNPAQYEVVLRSGAKHSISREKYEELVKKWNAIPVFVELNRSINYHGSCGKDGDMYKVRWDGHTKTSETYTWENAFENPVKISHSAFKFPDMDKEEADSLGLYHYPKFFSEYRQLALLSTVEFPDSVHLKLEYLNGLMGPRYKVKMFTLLFINKPLDIAIKQEQYWEGGNQNELVTCIGVDSAMNIMWVKPFSWCDNKRICIDTRDDIGALQKFDADEISRIYYKNIPKFFQYKSFKDFNYLKFDPTTGQMIFVYFIALVVSVACSIYIVNNDIEPYKPYSRSDKRFP